MISNFLSLQEDSSIDSNLEADVRALFPTGGIKKILLVTPPDAEKDIFQFETAKRGRYTNYPPYGLGLIATVLRDMGLEVQLCNLNHTILNAVDKCNDKSEFDFTEIWQTDLQASVEQFNPDFVGVTCMFTMSHNSLGHVCRFLKSLGQVIGVGGVHVSNDVDRVLNDIPAAQFAFLREGETSIKKFLNFVNGKGAISELGQTIVNLNGEDQAIHIRQRFLNTCRPEVEDISIMPAYDLMDIPDYSKVGTIGAFYCFKPEDSVFATVLSNRGCRAMCSFCSVRNFNGKGVRGRDYMDVVDEMEHLATHYGVDHIMFLDDDLLKDHKRALNLFNELASRNLGITWDATNGLIASSCTDEIVSAMAKSGCIAVNIGMESGNAKILKDVKKPGTVDVFIKAAKVFRKYEQIHTSILLMVGLPGEDVSMIQDTIDVAYEMDCDWYRVTPLQPLPNTPIYDAMIEQGLLEKAEASEVRFMGGSYGKQAEIERGSRTVEIKYKNPFDDMAQTDIPTQDKITDIWFHMNYHLNFKRILHEKREVKLIQLEQHLHTIADVISPENGFALYFQGFIQHKKNGVVEPELVARMKKQLEVSPYWQERLSNYGLSLSHLVENKFPDEASLA